MAQPLNEDLPARAPGFNWAQYADGKTWQLKSGDDFIASIPSLRSSAYQWASSNGYVCRTSQMGDDLAVQFVVDASEEE